MQIGDTLREARMRRRVDVSHVEEVTKIRAKYLRALENEDFHQLPGPTFVRSFLRTYAEYLGLDAHLLVEEYRGREEESEEWEREQSPGQGARPRSLRWPGGSRPAVRTAPGLPGARGGGAPGPPRPGRGVAAAVLVGGALLLLLLLGLTGEEGGPGAGAPGELADRTKGPGTRPRRVPPPRPQDVALRVAPVEPTYVCVDNGKEKVIFEGTLQTARSFRAKRLRINLGRRTARLKVNGRRVPTGAGADPTGFDFTPSRRRLLPPGERPC